MHPAKQGAFVLYMMLANKEPVFHYLIIKLSH
jgi:hypothetical protein